MKGEKQSVRGEKTICWLNCYY